MNSRNIPSSIRFSTATPGSSIFVIGAYDSESVTSIRFCFHNCPYVVEYRLEQAEKVDVIHIYFWPEIGGYGWFPCRRHLL
jgi:hypothetical protein